jgi:hypothetical protein
LHFLFRAIPFPLPQAVITPKRVALINTQSTILYNFMLQFKKIIAFTQKNYFCTLAMTLEKPDTDLQKSYSKYAKFMGLLIAIIVLMLVFTYAGIWADKYFHLKKPILTIIGLFIGLIIGFYNLIRGILKEKI